MTDSDDRNGGRPSQHPAALEAALEGHMKESAERFADEEVWIQRVDRRVGDIHSSLDAFQKGNTEWQLSVTRQLHRITDQIQVLMLSRLVWPTVTTLGVLFLGAFAAELVWRLATHH